MSNVDRPTPKKSCFVIGPMGPGRTERLHNLARNVVGPLLEEIEPGQWNIPPQTPDLEEPGKIMDQVIRELDRSDLVIVDITHDGPSVFYELAIRHCLGRPYVMVRDSSALVSEDVRVSFDVADYRWREVDLDPANRQTARDQLRDIIGNTLRLMAADAPFDRIGGSPISNFYRVPLTEVSAGAGLAYGYWANLVRPALSALSDNAPFSWGRKGPAFTETWWTHMTLHIFLPKRLSQANRVDIDRLTDQMFPLIFKSKTRDILLWTFPHREGCGDTLRLIDIPTTMGAIEESVKIRAGVDTDRFTYPWSWLERQEFERFSKVFLMCIQRTSDDLANFNLHAVVEEQFDIGARLDAGSWQR